MIPVETHQDKKTIPVVFKYPASSKDKEAFLVGSFTNWKDTVSMVKRFSFRKLSREENFTVQRFLLLSRDFS